MLTDDDKQWIARQVSEVIAQSEERTMGRIERVGTQLAQSEERAMARIERVETSLLTEFHKWASPLEMRVRSHATALRALDLELEAATERLTKLEDRQS